MNNALRNSIARPSLRAAVNSQDLVIDSGAATSLRPVQPGHCLDMVAASSHYIDSGVTVTGGTAVDISFTINPDLIFNGILGCGANVAADKGFFLVITAGAVSIFYSDGTTKAGQVFTGLTLSASTWYDCRLVWDGGASVPTLTVNGVDYVTASVIAGWAGVSADNMILGAYNGGATGHFDGKLGFCKYDGVFQYNNDFSSGTSAIDSSGNNNDGTLVNGPTWTTDNSLPYSWLNQVGYGGSSRVVWSGGAGWDDGCYSEESAAGDFVVRMPITEAAVNQFLGVNSDPTTTGGFTTLDNALLMTSSLALAAYESGVSKTSTTFIIGDVVEIIRVGTTITYLKNSVVFYTSLVSSTANLYVDTAFNGNGSNVSNVTLDGVYVTWVDVPNCTVSNLYIPRDEATPANDAFGNALEWSGSAFPRRPEYRGSYLSTWNGTTEYLAAAHLGGAETVVSNVGTSTPSISAGRVDFTAGTCSALVLSDGTIYNFAEGVGATAHDISGNGNDGTITNASTATEGAGFWAGRIDGEANAHNINNGFSRRMLFDGVNDAVTLNVSPDEILQTGVFDLSIDVIWDSSSIASVGRLIWFSESTGFFRIQKDAATSNFQLWARKSSGLDIIAKTAIVISADIKHTLRVVGDGVNCLVYLDGGLLNTIAMTTANFYAPTWSEVYLGYPASSGVKGVLYNWSLATASITQQLDGTGNTNADWLDTVGSNNGTVAGSPQLLRVPADSAAPTLDVYGSTLTNPAVANSHNDAETTWDFENIGTGDTIAPETSHLSNFDAVTFSDTNYSLGITSPIDSVFWRDKSGVLKDRATGYGATLTGAGLVYANNYTDG